MLRFQRVFFFFFMSTRLIILANQNLYFQRTFGRLTTFCKDYEIFARLYFQFDGTIVEFQKASRYIPKEQKNHFFQNNILFI